MDNNNQKPLDQRPLSPQAVKRNQMYRVAYLATGVIALIIYYGLPAMFQLSKHAAERVILFIAIPYFFFNAYVSSRWSDTISESLINMKNQRPGWYKFWRISSFGLLSAEKPMMPFTSLMWVVLGLSTIIWLFVSR